MTNKTEKPKRKRGRPKKTEAIVQQTVVEQPKEENLNVQWWANIHYINSGVDIKAGSVMMAIPEQTFSITPMYEETLTPGWNNVKGAIMSGVYVIEDSVTGTKTNHSLSGETVESWLENLEFASWSFPTVGGKYIIKDLIKQYV